MEILVHDIFWKEDSPFGTYLQNDEVKIYWDDGTELLIVRVNGSIETSGDDIPLFFTYGGQPETFYKTEFHYYTLVCNAARDKVDTYRTSSIFPYLNVVLYPDHPSCAASPVVCDLTFDSLPVVVNASAEGATDGEITVSASSSNGAIEYKLGSDFIYGDGDASGLFTGLSAGVYTVYARDEINCFAEITVKVGIDYAYGVLLRLEYNDIVGGVSRVDILQKGYSGSVTEVKGFSESPYFWMLRGEGEDDKFKSIITTESRIHLTSITDFQFLDLFTGDPDKFRVNFYKNSLLKFVHKLLPNQFNEDYKAPPYQAVFIANDGTAGLKDITFTDDRGDNLVGSYKQIALIAFCLKKIGLSLNIRCSINLYATGMASTASDDPLDQAYVDVDTYYLDKNTQPSCADVIKAILEPYGAQVIQWYGVWNILRVEERVATFSYREFTSDGVYSSNSTYNPIKEVVSPTVGGAFHWESFPTMQMLPGFGTIKLNYNLGLKDNILINGDFKLKVIFSTIMQQSIVVINTDRFQLIKNDAAIELIGYEQLDGGDVALQMATDPEVYILSDSYLVKMNLNDKIKFRLTYRTGVNQKGYPYQKIKVRVVYGTYYLQSDGTWTTTANDITYYATDFGKYANFEIVASPPTNVTAGLNLYTLTYGSSPRNTEFTTLAGLKAKVTTTLPLGTRSELLPSSTGGGVSDTLIYYYEIEDNTSAESIPNIVRPDDYNAGTNPVQWILKRTVSSSELSENPFYINKIQVQYLPEGKDAPKVLNAELTAEENNTQDFEKELFHGSLVENVSQNFQFILGRPFVEGAELVLVTTGVQNSDKIYSGYLRDNTGDGFTMWSRDNVPESRFLHDIYLRTISAQYSRPWRKMFGTLVSKTEYLNSIDSIRETLDSDRIYYPISIEADDKKNRYSGEWVELLDASDDSEGGSGSSGSGAGFTTGFSIGFDS